MARTPTKRPDKDQPGGPSREDEILMREIDEAVRQDDAKEFFEKYGVALGIVLAIVLIGMFGYWYWDSNREAELESNSEAIVSALDSIDAQDFEGASSKVDPLIDGGTPGARTVALMVQAAAALEQDDEARAMELYALVASDEEAAQPLRDLALIREISIGFDELEPTEIISRLDRLAVPGGNFFGSAGELVAIAHLEAGNRDEAGMLFAEIAKDESQPETLRARARQMAGMLGVDVIDDVEQLLEDEGVIAGQGATPAAPRQ